MAPRHTGAVQGSSPGGIDATPIRPPHRRPVREWRGPGHRGPRPSLVRGPIRRQQADHAQGTRHESGMAEPAHLGVSRRARARRHADAVAVRGRSAQRAHASGVDAATPSRLARTSPSKAGWPRTAPIPATRSRGSWPTAAPCSPDRRPVPTRGHPDDRSRSGTAGDGVGLRRHPDGRHRPCAGARGVRGGRRHSRAAHVRRPRGSLRHLEQAPGGQHVRVGGAAAVHPRGAEGVQRRVEPHRPYQPLHLPRRAAREHVAVPDADRAAARQGDLPLRVHAQLPGHLHRRPHAPADLGAVAARAIRSAAGMATRS